MYHTVVNGDTLWGISKKYNLSPDQIKKLNKMTSNALSLGQKLLVSATAASTTTSVSSASTSTTTSSSASSSSNEIIYMVKPGDSLFAVAVRHGVTVEQVKSLNRLTSNALSVDQKLRIPKAGATASASSSSTASKAVTVSAPITITETPLPTTEDVVKMPTAQDLLNVRRHRDAVFKMRVLNGFTIFGNGITGSVGKTDHNNPSDLQKVQTVLEQLNILNASHNENPSKLGASIKASQIPQTIAAIERFQKLRNIEWWAGKPDLIGSSVYSTGLVKPDDVTFRLLREYSEYKISFVDYQGKTQQVNLSNFVRSGYNVYPHGVSYPGTAVHAIPADYYRSIGLSNTLAQVLAFVSSNEGNYDAINSYDKAIFSFGFIQFAGSPAGGSLYRMMALTKHQKPDVFYDAFQRFGIDVEYTYKNERYEPVNLVVIDPESKDGRYLVRGEEAEKHVRANKLLTAVFLRAGHDPEVAKMQILRAVDEYVNPALRRKISFSVNGVSVNNEALSEFIRSEAGITTLVDMSVNKGVGGAAKLFMTHLELLAKKLKPTSLAALKNMDERQLLEQMVANESDSRIKQRVGKVLSGGLSTKK